MSVVAPEAGAPLYLKGQPEAGRRSLSYGPDRNKELFSEEYRLQVVFATWRIVAETPLMVQGH